MRAMGVWDEGEIYEVDELKAMARQGGYKIHLAECMAIGSLKNSETSNPVLKVRLVYRGDNTKDENNQIALFRELKSIPATIATVNLVLWYGLRKGHSCQIADARKAYLQALIKSYVPTYVILPRDAWKPQSFRRYRRVAARLRRAQGALYGHPTSGVDWAEFLDETVTLQLQGNKVEGWPSLWHVPALNVLVAAYVDDLVVAGPESSVPIFWELLTQYIQVDTIEKPGRYLGRNHLIFEFNGGRNVFMSMEEYAESAYVLYEEQFNQKLKVYDTPFMSEASLTAENFSSPGQLSGNASQLLMKLLWLCRLSRPDIAYAISALASNISRWCRNHDLMLCRLLGYVKGTTSMGVVGTVSDSSIPPSILMYADADLAGDQLTMRSHSGHFLMIHDDHGTSFPIYWSSKRQSCVSPHRGRNSFSFDACV